MLKIGVVFTKIDWIEGGTYTFANDLFNSFLKTNFQNSNFSLTIISAENFSKEIRDKFSDNQILTKRVRLGYKENLLKILLYYLRSWYQYFVSPHNSPSLSESYCNVLTSKISNLNLDIVWFTTPPPVHLNFPFIAPIYNLAHKEFPYYPEFSFRGEFNNRDNYYYDLISRSSGIVFTNSYHLSVAENFYNLGSKKILVQSLPTPSDSCNIETDRDLTLRKFKLNTDNFYCIYPANFWRHKNHIFLINVFKELKILNPNIKLLLTGSDYGELKTIKGEIVSHELEDQIIVLGRVKRSDLINLMSSSSVVLFPSKIGPDSIPRLEAQALGTPFISHHFTDDQRDNPNQNQFSISLDEQSRWTQKIIELVSSQNTRVQSNGSNNTAENYIKNVLDFLLKFNR